jgi:hypothetical protein
MPSEEKLSGLGGPTSRPAERGNVGALARLYDNLSEVDQQELLRYAIELTRRPKD